MTWTKPTFWRDRLAAALAYRRSLAIDGNAGRLVHGEADRLPGLVVDRYGDVLVVQTLTQGTDRRLADLTKALVELVAPRGILARNDPKVRRLEGLDEQVAVVFGDVPELVEVTEGAIRYDVDVRHGQKTGLFLDQRENHLAAAAYGRGRALDAFSYQGGFALQLAAACETVLALDSSAPAIAAIAANAKRNGRSNVEAREANVFDELRELEIAEQRFDTIVLDPPAFAKNKSAVPRAVAGYKEINLRALKLLEPGGCLITCSCSYNVDEALFSGHRAGRRARRARGRGARGETDAGARSSGPPRRARNALPQVPRPPEDRLSAPHCARIDPVRRPAPPARAGASSS